jgi:GH24 family phage-related lysozyme (muramidase)
MTLVEVQHRLVIADYARFVGQFEGRRTRAYRDSKGNRTIGAGHNLDRPGSAEVLRRVGLSWSRLVRGGSMTTAQVDALLIEDVSTALQSAHDLVPNFEVLPDEVRLIVVDMIYNLGRTGFRGFGDLREALARGDWRAAVVAMRDSDWYRQVPARSSVLISTIQSISHAPIHSNQGNAADRLWTARSDDPRALGQEACSAPVQATVVHQYAGGLP